MDSYWEGNPTGDGPRVRQTGILQQSVAHYWQGALPHPQDFAAYDEALPGAAERILAMAEDTSSTQNETIRSTTKAEVEYARTGQAIAFVMTGIAFAAAIIFFALGRVTAGGLLLSVPVVMLIRSFLRPGSKT